MKQNKGFTLIELMVSVAIIGALATIAIPAYTGYMLSARMTEAKNNISALKLAEEEYFLENNNYFDGLNAGVINTNSGGLWTVSGAETGIPIFDYVITLSGTRGYTIKATGKLNTAVYGKIEQFTK